MVFRGALNEYSGGKQREAAQNTPNVINLFYSHYEYENEYHIGSKESILYHAIKKLSFPDSYKNAMLMRPVFSSGNVRYAVKQSGRHNYDAIAEYFYNALPLYFKK